MNITFRKATIDDAKVLFLWRNDPLTRKNSINQGEILWEDHVRWFEKKLSDKSYIFLIAEDGENKIGLARANKDDDGFWELSWQIAPDQRGKGYGKEMVTKAVSYFSGLEMKTKAQVKKDNLPSIKIAESLFKSRREEDGVIWFF